MFRRVVLLFGAWAILAQIQAQSQGPSAYRVRMRLLEEALIPFEKRGHGFPSMSRLYGNSRTRISWGAIEVDSSSRLARLMSPSVQVLRELVNSLDRLDQRTFLYNFFYQYLVTKNYSTHFRSNNEKVNYALSIRGWYEDGFSANISLDRLLKKWEKWLTVTRGSPFSFLSPTARDRFFEGKMPGLENLRREHGSIFTNYEGWRPIFGIPEKYVDRVVGVEGGWQLLFKPQTNYARFEKMLSEIQNHSPHFGMPRWQSLHFTADASLEANLADAVKWSWALLALDEIREGRRFNVDILEDYQALSDKVIKTDSGVKYTVMLKFHRKNVRMRRFLQTSLAARIISGDWSGMDGMNFALARHSSIPLWNWEKAPFLSIQKKALLAERTQHYLAELEKLETTDRVRDLTRQWIYSTNLVDEIKISLRPWRREKNLDDVLNFRPLGFRSVPVDVNTIHLGMEYTGHFPLQGEITHVHHNYPVTRDTLGHTNRHLVMQNVLEDIIAEFGGDKSNIFAMGEGHGHNFGYGYGGTDALGRQWQVDWDGVDRHYTGAKVLEDSVGQGHLELITPKYYPSGRELEAIYQVFQRHNISTLGIVGGGHLNVDLKAFEGRPRALARFLSLYHQYRGIISLLFGEKVFERMEALEVSDKLALSLRDFKGSEDELKRLLYNQRYFNTRIQEKTRHVDINLMDYFQDVIPAEFISEDFDFMNPEVPWRRQFKVDPDVRRIEMRLFKAPKNAFEAALQIRLVRALLSKAFNEDSLLSGVVSKLDSQNYLLHPAKAWADLKRLCADLKLGFCEDYYSAMIEGLNDTDMFYRFFNYYHYNNSFREKEWGSALKRSRPPDQALSSQNRKWVKGKIIELCFEKMALLLEP